VQIARIEKPTMVTVMPTPSKTAGQVRAACATGNGGGAWSNFELIAEDGTVNEVDVIVATPKRLFPVEIKSWPGQITGDAGTWTWHRDGRQSTFDNSTCSRTRRRSAPRRVLLRRQRAPFHPSATTGLHLSMATTDRFSEPRQGLKTLRDVYTACNSLNAHTVVIAPRVCEHAQRVAYEIATGEEFPHPNFEPYHDPAGLARKMGTLEFYSPRTQAFLGRMQGWALAEVEYGGKPYEEYTKPGVGHRAGEIVNGVSSFLAEMEALVNEPPFSAAIIRNRR
jgi:hypothetical protein